MSSALSSLSKTEIENLAKRCMEVVSEKQSSLESTRLRLDGAAEGILFLMNSLSEALDENELTENKKKEAEGGKDNKPFLATTKA